MMDQYCIGSDRVPGLSKVIEECGEVVQVAGKIIGLGAMGQHWDGTDLRLRLQSELGDLQAAIDYVIEKNGLCSAVIYGRRLEKRKLFEEWHQGGPEPTQPVDPLAHASTSPGPVNCNVRQRIQQPNDAIPRSCRRCGLGPCPFFHPDGASKS